MRHHLVRGCGNFEDAYRRVVKMAVELEIRMFRDDQQSLRAKGYDYLTPLSPCLNCYSISHASADEDIVSSMRMVAEGIKTTDAALALGARTGVELPIATQMADVFAGRKDARAALEELMLRRQRAESDSGW